MVSTGGEVQAFAGITVPKIEVIGLRAGGTKKEVEAIAFRLLSRKFPQMGRKERNRLARQAARKTIKNYESYLGAGNGLTNIFSAHQSFKDLYECGIDVVSINVGANIPATC